MRDGNDFFGFPLLFNIQVEKRASDDSFSSFGVLKIAYNLEMSSYFPKTWLYEIDRPEDSVRLPGKLLALFNLNQEFETLCQIYSKGKSFIFEHEILAALNARSML